MENLTFKNQMAQSFINEGEIEQFQQTLYHLQIALSEKKTKGSDFLGWLNLPTEQDQNLIKDIQQTAKQIQAISDYFVVVGIGGSYLGARAAIEALSNNFSSMDASKPKILYAGHNLSEDYLAELVAFLEDKSFSLAVISKSGTTTEPAVAFRILKNLLENKFGTAGAQERIIAITDAKKGALKTLATQKHYKTYVVPDDVGGRFSVLTAVGLLPIAVAGFDVGKLMDGARRMQRICGSSSSLLVNPAALYAVNRNILYQKNFSTEILVNYQPKLQYLGEWWKQLFGESEGKEGKGIFPASVNFTTDLHSMGQYIQEGRRILFETTIHIQNPEHSITIPKDEQDLDGLNYLAGKNVEFVNQMAEKGTALAHTDGGVPQLQIVIPKLDAFYLGQLFYFFELACAYSGLILDVNPFNQPGVEAYKKNMFSLLGKKGYENEALRKRAGL